MIESFDNWDSVTSYIKLSNITLVITRKKYIMAEFASKGVAGSGLGLGIAGTALGLLNNGGNGGGVLSGLFGNNNQAKFSCLDGTIANMMGTLGKITDTVVPMDAICPTPMAKYNSWTAPTTTPATGG